MDLKLKDVLEEANKSSKFIRKKPSQNLFDYWTKIMPSTQYTSVLKFLNLATIHFLRNPFSFIKTEYLVRRIYEKNKGPVQKAKKHSRLEKLAKSKIIISSIIGVGKTAIYFSRKDMWSMREQMKRVGKRIYYINPAFTKFGIDYLVKYFPQRKIREKFEKKHGFLPPSSLNINPGDGCQLNCVGCATGYEREKKTTPSYENLEKIALQLKGLGARQITFTGGEPLAEDSYENVFRLIDRFPRYFFSLFTNGIGLDDNIAELMNNKMNTFVFVSVDGVEKESEKIRGENTFKHSLKAIETLNKYRVAYGISLTVRKSNYKHIASNETLKFFEEKDAITMFYLPFMPFNPSLQHEALNKEERKEFSEMLKANSVNRNILTFDYTNPMDIKACRAATKNFYVSSAGEVSPCFAISASLGNIYRNSLEEVITSPIAKAMKDLKAENPDKCLAQTNTPELMNIIKEHKAYLFSQNIVNLANFQAKN